MIWEQIGAQTSDPIQASSTFRPAGGFDVQGNKAKFRELEDVTDGFSGGLQKFSVTQELRPEETLSIQGHLLEPQQDIGLKLALDKTDLGFVHAGFEQWRRYYSADGGYDPAVTPSQFTPNRDLYLDNGRAWVDFGLDLPHWPQMVLGYEYQFRNGTESTLDWGDAKGKNIYPATQGVDEATHIIKFDVTKDLSGWHLEDSTRIEFYTEKNHDTEGFIQGAGSVPDLSINTRDNYHQAQGMNTLMIEKSLRDWWFLSGGFCCSRIEGNDLFNQTTASTSAGLNTILNSQRITLGQDSEIFSLASLFTPMDYLTFSLGMQNEWTHEQGFGASVPDLDLALNTPALTSFDASQSIPFRFASLRSAPLHGMG